MERMYNRRQFLKTAGIYTAGLAYLASPLSVLASSKTQYDFSKDSEKTLIAKLLCGESSSIIAGVKDKENIEPVMIGYTIINRVKDKAKWNGKNIKEVILKKRPRKDKNGNIIYVHQYSCFNSRDPNLKKMKNPEKYYPKHVWEQALSISENILKNKLSHLNYGQDHYHAKKQKPTWADNPRMKKIWGQPYFKHLFYKDKLV